MSDDLWACYVGVILTCMVCVILAALWYWATDLEDDDCEGW